MRLAQSLSTAKRVVRLLFSVAFGIICAAMISSFKHKGLRDFFETNSKRGIPPELATRLRDRLDVIDAAGSLDDIALPHFGLHQ